MIYLVVAAIAWIIAQSTKYVLNVIETKSFRNTHLLVDSGRMPSAHSATCVSMTTMIGLVEGVNTAIFALAALFSFVVMYDAAKVRRSVGEQGTLLNKIAVKLVLTDGALPRNARGHKPEEVIVGALLGVLVSLLIYLLTHHF